MANYSLLVSTINAAIKQNGNQEITGPVLNSVLNAMVRSLGNGWQFGGVATPATAPGTPDQKMSYIAIEPGAYSNFGVTVPNGSIGIIYNTSSDWAVTLINTYYVIDVDTLMQDSPSSEDINKAIGSFTYLKRAITVGVPFFGKGASGGNSTVAIAQVKQLSDIEVRVVMLNTGTVDGSNELVPIIKKITNSAGQLSLSTEAPTSFIGPLSSLNTNKKGSVVEAINEVNTGLKSAVKPYVINLTNLLAAQDSESISTAIGGIDNLNGTVQKNQVIFGTLANGTVAVGIRVLGNQTTLTYFVDSVVGLTVNEVIITNTSGTLTKTANTHAVLTENMVVNSLESDETTLPLSAAQGKVLSEEVETNTSNVTKIDKAIGNPVIEDVDLSTPDEDGYYWTYQNVKSANSGYRIKHIPLNKGDLLIVDSYAGNGTNIICITDSTYASPVSDFIMRGIDMGRKVSYLADKNCFVALSYIKSLAGTASIVRSTQNAAIADITTSTAALHKVYESYGAVYNAETGYWEYDDLKDLTEKDCFLATLYALDSHVTYSNGELIYSWPSRYYTISARTFFTKVFNTFDYTGRSSIISNLFAQCIKLEYVKFVTSTTLSSTNALSIYYADNAFRGCIRLKKIANMLKIYKSAQHTFDNCSVLTDVRVEISNVDVSFKDSPLISYESLNYLVTNAVNTSAITVTVHPTTYSYLTGTAQPTAEVGGTTEEWQALVTAAQGKQISFAVPEETQSEVTE